MSFSKFINYQFIYQGNVWVDGHGSILIPLKDLTIKNNINFKVKFIDQPQPSCVPTCVPSCVPLIPDTINAYFIGNDLKIEWSVSSTPRTVGWEIASQ